MGSWFDAVLRAHGSETMVAVLSESSLGFTVAEARKPNAFSQPGEHLMARDAREVRTPQQAIEQLVDVATTTRATLDAAATGAQLDILIGVSADGDQVSMSLDPELMEQLASNRVAVLVAIYPDT